MAQHHRMPIESGCPDGFQYMHPVMRKNYGQWKFHDHPRPGVLRHVAYSGDEIWTVKAGTQRILDVFTLRKLCDIGDQYADGHVRFTIRSNIEYMISDGKKVEPLINALEGAGFIVGGTANSVAMISHTQGWLHCDIPGTDASGVVKAMMDELVDEFKNCRMPNRVHITTSCCPPMQINDPEHTKLAIWVGGNHSNARSKPTFQRLVAAGIPNNPPRWPEATAIVKRILKAYREDAQDWERVNDWIERIGWPRFFELTNLPFTKFHVDNWRGSRRSLNASTYIRF
jgi:dissimilatory sulfite reductase (desulfoviridin) alpha/beta subunit